MTALYNDDNVEVNETHFLTRDPWRTFTPTVTQLGAVTVTVTYARYAVLGDTVHMNVLLAVTGTGTANNVIVISGIPSVIAPTNTGNIAVVGSAIISNTGTAGYQGSLIAFGPNDFRVIVHNTNSYVGVEPNFGLANNDAISFQATYERDS